MVGWLRLGEDIGTITKGLDVAKAILALNSGEGDLGGAPSKPVKIDILSITEK